MLRRMRKSAFRLFAILKLYRLLRPWRRDGWVLKGVEELSELLYAFIGLWYNGLMVEAMDIVSRWSQDGLCVVSKSQQAESQATAEKAAL